MNTHSMRGRTTAAKVIFQGCLDGLTRRLVRLAEEYRGSQQHSRRAKAALETAVIDKRLLQWVQCTAAPETFDRNDVFAGDIAKRCLA